jgi:hypothetical protein
VVVDVDVRAEPPAVALEDPEDCKAFSVRVRGDRARLAGVLVAAGVGHVEGDEALIGVDAVRRMAEGRAGPGWDGAFAAMLDYAGTKGWMADDRRSIRAHVEEA